MGILRSSRDLLEGADFGAGSTPGKTFRPRTKPSGISVRELERDPSRSNGQRPGVAALPALAVIGRGRAGGSIARAAEAAGLTVRIGGRDHALQARPASAAAPLLGPVAP